MSGSVEDIAKNAKAAFDASQLLTSEARTDALAALKQALADNKDHILEANRKDVEAAKELVAAGTLSKSLVSRLDLQSSPDKFDSMLEGISSVASLPDPTGQVTYRKKLDDGLELCRVTCPIGVILVIFEARPEVIVNITALAIKSGNAAILKGGKESLHTQAALTTIIQRALSSTPLPASYIQTVSLRSEIASLLSLDKYIDLVIPRGSNALVSSIKEASKIPVMGHADGICSTYLDASASLEKAKRIVVDAKLSYPSACNATETLIVHEDLLNTLWPDLAQHLLSHNIELHCDSATLTALELSSSSSAHALVHPSTPEDYDTEFLSPTLAVLAVPSLASAIEHINTHSSHHTDAIITESSENGRVFSKGVGSAGVYVNASTRFADGMRYGFGTEVGVATGKTHARGPVGLEGLVIYKYQVVSTSEVGHITTEFGEGADKKKYLHEDIPLGVAPF